MHGVCKKLVNSIEKTDVNVFSSVQIRFIRDHFTPHVFARKGRQTFSSVRSCWGQIGRLSSRIPCVVSLQADADCAHGWLALAALQGRRKGWGFIGVESGHYRLLYCKVVNRPTSLYGTVYVHSNEVMVGNFKKYFTQYK